MDFVGLMAGPADTITSGSGTNDFVFGSVADSPGSATDIIKDFNVSTDMFDLTGLGTKLNVAGKVSSTLAADSVGWETVGHGRNVNTYLFVNTSTSAESLNATDMKIDLKGAIALSSTNIVHL
jgi:Ca2+-binding RTX toxin-like protein